MYYGVRYWHFNLFYNIISPRNHLYSTCHLFIYINKTCLSQTFPIIPGAPIIHDFTQELKTSCMRSAEFKESEFIYPTHV
jgi:hypothetical protein